MTDKKPVWNLLEAVERVNALPPPVYCSHCGRILTDKLSKERGIGPICATQPEGESE